LFYSGQDRHKEQLKETGGGAGPCPPTVETSNSREVH